MITLDKPLHLHDCGPDHCTFIGNHNGDDLYVYTEFNGRQGVIARHSSEGSDYSSGGVTAPILHGVLVEPYRRVLRMSGQTEFTVPWMYTQSIRQEQADMLIEVLDLGEDALPIMLDAVTLIIHEVTGNTLARINYDHDTY